MAGGEAGQEAGGKGNLALMLQDLSPEKVGWTAYAALSSM